MAVQTADGSLNTKLDQHSLVAMPLFRQNQPAAPPPPPSPPQQSPGRSRSLFSRRRSPSPEPYTAHETTSNTSSRGGFFSRRRSSSSSDESGSNYRSGSLGGDPTISAARQKVSDAENYEREADRALGQARAAVREARDHVRILEREALEDARRAKMKQAEAKTVSKSARGLGRHG
ncbi:hypothetical protein EIP91_003102 [Steccherinum ochraceum]|uniref:Uncharacterized protein n=1 Tax=Steccherinum ochraceum TaxID=92696 RepID=A0A4R0REE2_9APHY|nr:hypothetical protein EIP91_003102 [Steccherinum ochraceum]